jgi:hypothetical protein
MVRLKVILANQSLKPGRRRSTLRDYDCGAIRLRQVTSGNPQPGVSGCYGEGATAKQ